MFLLKPVIQHFQKPQVDLKDKNLIAVFTAYNEIDRIDFFLSYYRKMGVQHFLAIDNNSSDGSAELLKAQPDVTYFHTAESYAGSKAGRLWTSELANHYCIDKWCLTLDLDEQLVFPASTYATIADLCEYCDDQGFEGIFTVFLDMYSAKSLGEAVYRRGQPFLDVCDHFETDNYTLTEPMHFPHVGVFGGPRQRIFWEKGQRGKGPSMRKLPLIKWRRGFKYLHSTHSSTPVHLADVTAALLHFKFFASFKDFSAREVERGDRIQVADYANYARVTGESEVHFRNEHSIRYKDSTTLVEHGVMVCPPKYLRWMRPRMLAAAGEKAFKPYEDALHEASSKAMRDAVLKLTQLPVLWSLMSTSGDGDVLSADDRTIFGWYLDRSGRYPTREIEAHVDGKVVATGDLGAKVEEWTAVEPEMRESMFRIVLPQTVFTKSNSVRVFLASRRDPKPFASVVMRKQGVIGANSEYRGECHLNQEQGRIGGWVWAPDDPNHRLSVTVHIDGVYWCTLAARHFRQSLQGRDVGDGAYGFSAELPTGLSPSEPHVASLTIQGTNVQLDGSPIRFAVSERGEGAPMTELSRRPLRRLREEEESAELFAPSSGFGFGQGLIGRVFALRRGAVYGWVADESDWSRPLTLELVVNGKVARSASATQSVAAHGEMPNHLLGHGFALPVGAALLGMGSATQSEVSLRVKETGDFLAEHLTPPTASTLSRSPYRGFVDGSDDGFLRGWVWRVGADDPIEIAVFIDGKFFTRVRAARFREDLRERLVGKGYHGFSVKMPASVTEAPNATIDVVVAGDGVPLHYPQISIVGDLIRPNRSAMRRMLDGARSIRGKSRIA